MRPWEPPWAARSARRRRGGWRGRRNRCGAGPGGRTTEGAGGAPLPQGTGSLSEALADDPRFATFADLVQSAGLNLDDGRYTVFAPTDAAFQALPQGALASLREDPERLRALLAQHVVAGDAFASDEIPDRLDAAAGVPISVSVVNDQPLLSLEPNDGGAAGRSAAAPDSEVAMAGPGFAVVQPQPVGFAQGVIHGINRVLLREQNG